MYYEIYLDVLFLVNFVMDYIVLSITVRIMRATVSVRTAAGNGVRARLIFYLRKVLAAFLGAIWVCAMLLLRLHSPLWNAVTYLVICGLMVFTAAGRQRPGAIVRGMGIMYLTTCALGGFIHVLYYYTTIGFFLNGLAGRNGENASVWVVLGGSVIAAPAIRLFWEFAVSRLSQASAKSVAVISNKGREVRLSALCDTGNSLTDPICGEPVNVVESECVQKLISSYEECSYHLIPYSAIGSERGLIPVVRFEKLTVIGEGGAFVVESPLFALYSGKFAANTDYRVILHPMMFGGMRTFKKASGTKG